MNRKNVRKRSLGREFALKALYLRDIRDKLDDDQLRLLAQTEDLQNIPVFGKELIDGCLAELEQLDGIIQKVATNWRLERMPNIDRNILRIGAYELMHCPETPHKVIINEAIEMSKTYGTEDSPNFINGVLDQIYTEYSAPLRSDQTMQEQHSKLYPRLSNTEFKSNPDKKADLHLHSDASDGELSPEAVVIKAKECGLDAVSLTDHDSVEGVRDAIETGKKMGIAVIPGVEMSAYLHSPNGSKEHELHILGYFIEENDKELNEELEKLRHVRIERVRKIESKLAECDIHLDGERIINEHYSTVGRLHVAQELLKMGVCKTINEVFEKYLGTGKPAYVPKEKLSVRRTIYLIHQAGGCAVLAHPGLTEGIENVMEKIEQEGIDGIEVHYPEHDAKTEAFWMDTARKNDLAITGGSDFHGERANNVTLGQETVSFVEISRLLEKADSYRRR